MNQLPDLSAVYEATRAIGLTDSWDDLIDEILDRARDLIGVQHCALMIHDPEKDLLRVHRLRGYGERAEEIRDLVLRPGEGISGWAAEHRTAVRVDDTQADPRYVEGLRGARSNLAVPLAVGDELAGVINVESERTAAFTERDEKLLTILGAQAALALLAARARRHLQVRIAELDVLYRISRLASRDRDLEETLETILQITREIFPEGKVAILLRDEGQNLRVEAAEGYRDDVGELIIAPGEGVTGRCAERAETVVVDEVDRDPGYIRGVPRGRSEIAIPLQVDGEVIGVLDAEATRAGAFSDQQKQTLSVIAQQIAAVLHTVQLHEETRQLAVTDSLTGLHNRRYFLSRLEEHVARARRYGETLALLLLDCDRLKRINDRHGHHHGDRTLVRIAQLLRETLRETDETARLGGDEFALLLLNADAELTTRVIERLRGRIEDLELAGRDGSPMEITASLGAALFPGDAESAHELLRRADEALYTAKAGGGNRLVFFDEGGHRSEAPGEGVGYTRQ